MADTMVSPEVEGTPTAEGNKYAASREKLKVALEKKGYILPASHQFTQAVRTVSEKLGVPVDTDFMVLDSEDVEAFFHPDSKIVVFSRGFGRYLMEYGLELKEDHLTAILGHELEHAHVIGADPSEQIGSNLLLRLKAATNHAEEYRADADGMRRMSRAGYNPTAMVEFHRTLSLTHGRFGLSHPEQIDRIRHLEDRLADDEHPLSHTTKDKTPFDPELMTWFLGDSDFYQEAESLLHSTPDQLQERLLNSKTQREFWIAWGVLTHVERIANAKALVDADAELLENIFRKYVVLEALRKVVPYANEPLNPTTQVFHAFRTKEAELPKDIKEAISFSIEMFGVEHPLAVFEASEFRNIVPSLVTSTAINEDTKNILTQIDTQLDRVFQGTFRDLENASLDTITSNEIKVLKDYLGGRDFTEEVANLVFRMVDKDFQHKRYQDFAREQQQRGLRAGGELKKGYLDLKDPAVRDSLVEQMKLDMVIRLVDIPNPSPEVVTHFASVVSQDTGMNPEGASIIANIVLLGQTADAWDHYLKGRSKEELAPIIRATEKLIESGVVHFSPLRPLHNSYKQSSEMEWRKKKSFAPSEEFALDAAGMELLRMLPARELYLRGYPEGYQLDWHNRLASSEINLTLEEWNLVVEGNGTHSAWMERDQWVLERYIEQIKSGNLVDPAIVEQFKQPMWADVTKWLSPADLRILIEHSPWNEQELLRKLTAGLTNLPHEAETSAERMDILETLRLAHKFYTEKPFKPLPNDYYFLKVTSPETIASHMLDILTQEIESQGISPNLVLIRAVQQLTEANIAISYPRLSDKIFKTISNFSDQDYEALVSYLSQREGLNETQIEFLDIFKLLKEGHSDERVVVNRIPEPKVIDAIIAKHQEGTVQWALENFPSSTRRDIILANLISLAPENLRAQFIREARGHFSNPPDYGNARKTGRFPFGTYLYYRRDGDKVEFFKGEGRLRERYDDLLTRRHPFSTMPLYPDLIVPGPRDHGYSQIKAEYGSLHQRFLAQELIAAEGTLLNLAIPLDERVQLLQDIVQDASAVRDIPLEMMLEDELHRAKTPQERVAMGRMLLPLFTEKSSIKGQLATVVFRSELMVRPEMVREFNTFMELVSFYLPEPSLERNYFLNLLENSAALTPEQLKTIASMRISPEGKKSDEDSAPMTQLVDRMGELSREEKVKATLWFLGLSEQKPRAIIRIEQEFDGHLNNLPRAVAASTDTEKEVLFQRFFLGAEGILDLEAVPSSEMELAISQRRELITTLAQHLLPDSMPNAPLFRDIFSSIIESSDPAHAARTLIKLINKFTEAQVRGTQLPAEEVVALGLNQLGVVGKKVSQSLAELDWVPDSYKRTFRKAQEEGEVVPKRALLILAEDAGLLDENAPLRIVSFNDLIGAASNKQAVLLTVEVNDESVGLPKGRHELVGKFKRPSAQKTENINHDLRVLRGILDILNREGYAEALPRDFSAQISNAVRRELDFAEEKKFSEEIKIDLNERNSRRKFKVSIPTIYFVSDDVMLESVASGISLRAYQNLRESGVDRLIASGYGAMSERNVNQTLVTEALAELITTGNIHADLHPGNIFVDQQGNLTLIDFGMHEKLISEQRLNTISLIAGLATGNEAFVKRALSNLGWNLGDIRLDLKRFNFGENATQLLRASQRVQTPPSEVLGSIILATSKLPNFTKGFSNAELARMLISVVDRREAPRIITHLIQSGARDFLTRQ